MSQVELSDGNRNALDNAKRSRNEAIQTQALANQQKRAAIRTAYLAHMRTAHMPTWTSTTSASQNALCSGTNRSMERMTRGTGEGGRSGYGVREHRERFSFAWGGSGPRRFGRTKSLMLNYWSDWSYHHSLNLEWGGRAKRPSPLGNLRKGDLWFDVSPYESAIRKRFK